MCSCSMGLRHTALIDGAVIPYVSAGSGDPTVVFEAGIGDGLNSWKPVFKSVVDGEGGDA